MSDILLARARVRPFLDSIADRLEAEGSAKVPVPAKADEIDALAAALGVAIDIELRLCSRSIVG